MLNFIKTRFEETLGALILAVMAVVAFLNVVVRYCTNFSFAWSEEVTINLFVWAVLLGTSAVFRDGEHLGMNIFYNRCSRHWRVLFTLLAALFGIVFFLTLFWYGMLEVYDEFDLEASSESLGIPVWIYTGAVPLLSLLVVARIVQRIVLDITQHKI